MEITKFISKTFQNQKNILQITFSFEYSTRLVVIKIIVYRFKLKYFNFIPRTRKASLPAAMISQTDGDFLTILMLRRCDCIIGLK